MNRVEEPSVAAMNGTSTVQGQSKAPYDFDHHGSFYSAAKEHREERLKNRKYEDKCDTSDALLVPFRFMDLPFELQRMVFKMITATYLQFDRDLKAYANVVVVGRHSPWEAKYDSRFGRSFEQFLAPQLWYGKNNTPAPMLPERRARMKREYIQNGKDFVYVHKEHPNRDGYYVEVFGRQSDWSFLEWYRKLSNVNRQFRSELGCTLWAKSAVSSSNELDCRALTSFINATPGAWNGIKKLTISVGFADDRSAFEGDRQESTEVKVANFISLIDLLSQRLTLEYFELVLGALDIEVIALADGSGSLSVLTNIRRLKVTGSFHLNMEESIEFEDRIDDHNFFSEYAEFLAEWLPKARNAIMPDTLRSQNPQRNQEDYSSTQVEKSAE